VTVYVALLRAVNVGGSGALAMATLRQLCVDAGFLRVETYIASGNVVFESDLAAARAKATLEKALQDCGGAPVGVALRTAEEMRRVLADNPFPEAAPNRTVAIFLDLAPPASAIATARGVKDEQIVGGAREIYIHYPSGQGRSKLAFPDVGLGTARNMNTVAKLADMASARRSPGRAADKALDGPEGSD